MSHLRGALLATMRTRLVLAGLVSAAAVVVGVQVLRPHASTANDQPSPKTKGAPPKVAKAKRPKLEDDRSHLPGIHRAGPRELETRNRIGAEESAKLQRRLVDHKPSVPSTTWVSLGPTDAPEEFNYFPIASVDSGRPSTIVVDPRNADVVYLATSGGGLWKTFDFQAPAGPTWVPTTDTQPNLAIGALALDAAHPDTVYIGNGDFVDGSGNTILKSTDGGGTWSAPVVLDGTYPGSQIAAKVRSIRQITADDTSVWVATDVGLFHSTDSGATFALFDLPETGGGVVAEALWNILPLGGGGFIASGITACAPGAPPPFLFGSDPDPQNCPLGNNSTIWRTDDGTTWSQVTTLPAGAGTGRTTIAVGPTAVPANTVVYAFVGDTNGFSTKGFWRSKDGGKTWADATGSLANPTLVDPNMDDTCIDINVGHDQTWYNQAIVVDPTNADHVLVGGNLCGMRALDATSGSPTWQLVSHWLPGNGYGETAAGRLPYVHADWHAATSVFVNGKVRTFAGTDGGIFSSTNLFDPNTTPESVVWKHHNRGLATHLFYTVVSGDPATGNAFTVYGGLQDNGTRFRNDPAHPSGFNQAIGGDGIGGAIHASSGGTTYWGSVEFQWAFCKPALHDCSTEEPEAVDPDPRVHWVGAPSPIVPAMTIEQVTERANERATERHDESAPFLVHYSDVPTDSSGQSVLTHTDEQVYVAVPDAGVNFTWKQLTNFAPGGAGLNNVVASRFTPGLYGAVGASASEPFYVTTQGNTKTDWAPAQAVRVGTHVMVGPASLDFPPTLASGQVAGKVFVGSFVGTLETGDPPADDKGRLWRTTDGGQNWTSLAGTDPAHRLPNVPIYVVKYDPVTATTIYAGTDIGVYLTTDDGATWNRMGDNLPMVPVRDMYVASNQEFIRIATYGRGVWEINPSAGANHGSPGNGDYDRNLKLDWIDVAAMSSRLGVTPATTTAPLYSWIMDITEVGDPPVASIDTSDLTALLAKFGDHP